MREERYSPSGSKQTRGKEFTRCANVHKPRDHVLETVLYRLSIRFKFRWMMAASVRVGVHTRNYCIFH